MTIKRYTPETILEVGQWINSEGLITAGFAGAPSQIVEVRPKSVVVLDRRDDGKTRVKMNKSIQFVSDTEAEGNSLMLASREHVMLTWKLENELRAKLAAIASNSVSELINNN